MFTLRLFETGQFAGQAVICAGARYASVWWQGATRPDRRQRGTELTIQYLYQEPMADVGPAVIAAELDQRLRAVQV